MHRAQSNGHDLTGLLCFLCCVVITTVVPSSVPVTVDLEKHLHLDFHATSLVEMSLSANLPKTTVEDARLRWRVMNETKLNTAADGKVLATSATRVPAGPMTVTLRPREIKTFLLNAEPEDGK